MASISECPSVVVVLTPDKGKWTRCGVVEETEIASLAALPATLQVQSGLERATLRVAGSVNAPGAPMLVMDIAAVQALMGRTGEVSRIDLRLAPGTDTQALLRGLALRPHVIAQPPGQAGERADNLSRAYRVNLTVLALVALFTGGFLVFSVLSLSVARRQQQIALLGVVGLSAPERLRLVLAESAVLGLIGSALGVALGTGLAVAALRLLGGELGGGYFSGVAPSALEHARRPGLRRTGRGRRAGIGGWWPARAAAHESSPFTYVIADKKSKEAAIIDPVIETYERDTKFLADLGLNLRYILDTHVHADHITAANELRKATDAKTAVSAGAGVQCVDINLEDGQELLLADKTIRAIATPGHTDSCMSFYFDGKVFSGDTLLIRGCGRTDFQQGSNEKLFHSVREKLFQLPDDTQVYPAHHYRGNSQVKADSRLKVL